VTRAGITPGMRVLDVACGTGNAAFPAARVGARVTGLDLTEKLLEAGRAKARAEGLEIEWREGGAENLPFEDGTVDRGREDHVRAFFGHFATDFEFERHVNRIEWESVESFATSSWRIFRRW
jgi:SAM-dependent methyltransferase